jgi:hypothetical protein
VGYANPWVRPPPEVYLLVPVTNFDGVEASYRSHFDGFTNTLRGTYGSKNSRIPGGGEAKARDGVTFVDTVEWGASTFFAQYSNFRLTIDGYTSLFDGFKQFGPEGRAIAKRYDVDNTRFEVAGFGMRYDPGDWFVMGEWARLATHSYVGRSHGWYLTGGYRLGSITPYVTLARVGVDSRTSASGLNLAGLPPSRAAAATGLNTGLNQILASAAAQSSISVGARWDFARNLDLKIQFDHLDLGAGSRGVLTNLQPGFRTGGSASLFSIALDFVF